MDFRIVEETADVLPEYGSVPIGFEVNSRFRVERISDGLGGIRLIEEAVEPPYIKDYDRPDGPERWARKPWDLSNWIFLGVFRGHERIGGAIVAFHVHDMNYCEGREDLAGLWDIRVSPEYRGRGVGKSLFQHAETCARNRGCTQLKIETQNVNVAACRFYARMGARLGKVNMYAYHADGLDEVELTWYKELWRNGRLRSGTMCPGVKRHQPWIRVRIWGIEKIASAFRIDAGVESQSRSESRSAFFLATSGIPAIGCRGYPGPGAST